ncbi:tissue factor pathway inhibitor 2-like [Crotalus tigris]|uniref:tissue factor pathway inhibitor 2-like n=1 Tax=Crotalus tigris TaxID=88082 RepID=UPI00192F25E3|nr:tissue factor pathway inhibitor 2-like [Crotalus tigris]
MRSGGSLLHLLLLLFWGDFALCIPELILADSYDGNCFQFHENLKQCGEPVDRFFYNVINERCETFVDYGCPARLNRYISMEQCLEYCHPKNDGNCFQFHRNLKQCGKPVDLFFYNILKKRCETFVDYGCPGRLNRYISMEQCLEYCDPKNVCHLPPIKGVCNYKRERWFFDPKTKSCKSLIFMGCGGYNINNNFERKWLCERTCR